MLSISIDTEELENLESYYSGIQERSQNFQAIEQELGDLQRQELKLRFLSSPATEVGGIVHGEVYWNRLSNWYLNQNPRRRGKQIMIDTQRLMRDSTVDGSGNTSRVEGNRYEFSINTSYAQKQHDLRSLLFWSEGLLEKTEAVVLDYILNGKNET